MYLPLRNPEVIVPNLIGKELNEAREILNKNKLKLKISTRLYNSDYPSNTIISQKPLSGQKKRSETEVEVVVSNGPESVRIPDLIGKTQLEAQIRIGRNWIKFRRYFIGL